MRPAKSIQYFFVKMAKERLMQTNFFGPKLTGTKRAVFCAFWVPISFLT